MVYAPDAIPTCRFLHSEIFKLLVTIVAQQNLWLKHDHGPLGLLGILKQLSVSGHILWVVKYNIQNSIISGMIYFS